MLILCEKWLSSSGSCGAGMGFMILWFYDIVNFVTETGKDGMHDDGVFNDCLINDNEFDDETASINSNMSVIENNITNDAFDSQLELMDDEDYDDND